MDPKDKTALITGGAHRVGKAITMALAEAGANVIINYHSSGEAARQTAAEAESLGVNALPIQADVSDYEQVQRMVTTAAERFGPIDILVNSASYFKPASFPMDDLENWHRTTGTVINGSFYCANLIAPMMLEKGAGAIINIVDLSAWEAWPNFTPHSVGKAALLALTRQLALELAPAIRVNAIAPGPVLPPPHFSQAQTERVAQRTLLERWGAPEDVSEAVIFLIRANYITGEVLTVDGGERIGIRK